MRISEPRWLTPQDVIAACRIILDPEPPVVFEIERLTGALQSIENQYYYGGENDVVVLGAKLLLALATRHPFMNGNKRTAVTSAAFFLEINGYQLEITDSDDFERLLRETIVGLTDEATFIDLFDGMVVAI